MNHKDAFNAITGSQFNKRNEAHMEGWRCHNEGYKITMVNVKTGAEYVGYRDMNKSGKWSRVRWQA